MGFSAGVMLVASFLSLIVPALDQARVIYPPAWSLPFVLIAIAAGYFFIIIVHGLIPHDHIYKDADMNHKEKFSRVTLIVLAMTLHNFPEGLTVGVGFGGGDETSGMALAVAIALQNMPEGLVVALGLLSEGASKNKAFLMALMSGLVEPIAAIFGYATASYTQYSLPVSLGFAGGTMLFVICQELLPELFRKGSEKHATFGVIIGIMVMLSIDFYFS